MNSAPFGNKKLYRSLRECTDAVSVRSLLSTEKVIEKLTLGIKYYKQDNTSDVDRVQIKEWTCMMGG